AGETATILAKRGIDGRERCAGQIRQDGRGHHEIVDAIERDPIIGAYGGLASAERIPREAERWAEVLHLVLEEIARYPVDGIAGRGACYERLIRDQNIVAWSAGGEADFP